LRVEKVSRAFEIRPAAGAEQTVGADLGEAAREDVLEKAREESVHRKRETARLS
jgi:hypothetical protein